MITPIKRLIKRFGLLMLGMGALGLVEGNLLRDLDGRQALPSSTTEDNVSFTATWISPSAGATFNLSGKQSEQSSTSLSIDLNLAIMTEQMISTLSLILCQVDDTSGQTPSYTYIDNVADVCISVQQFGCETSSLRPLEANETTTIPIALVPTGRGKENINDKQLNFFYCFSDSSSGGSTTCSANSYSPLFNFDSEPVPAAQATLLATASTLILSSTTAVISNTIFYTASTITASSSQMTSPSIVTVSDTSVTGTITGSGGPTIYCPDCATVSVPPTGTVTVTPTPTFIADASTHGSGSSGLSLGAKIGIALGGAVFVFLLILLVFFLVRRRRKQTTNKQNPDHLMHSHTMQNNDSHDLFMAEKDFMSGPTSVEETSTPLTANSRNSLNNYDAMSESNVGSAYTTNGAITLPAHSASNSLERNLLPATLQELHPNPNPSPLAHSLSRGISIASSRPISANSSLHHTNPLTHNPPSRPVSPRSINPTISRAVSTASGISARSLPPTSHSHEALPGDGLFAEPYSDLPHNYGDGLGGLPNPQVYRATMHSPFLSVEPGMSEEEMRRLEEEERRIDAAIAEAERERGRAR